MNGKAFFYDIDVGAGIVICSSSIFFSAEAELVWHLTTRVSRSSVSLKTVLSILCDIVPVNNTSKSGVPILLTHPFIFGNTLALQAHSSQSSLYFLSIHSFPPTITTLIIISFLG